MIGLVHPCCERLAFFVDSFAIFLRPFSFQCPVFITFKFFECLIPCFSKLSCLCCTVILLFFSLPFKVVMGPYSQLFQSVPVFFCCFVLPWSHTNYALIHRNSHSMKITTMVAYRFIVIRSVWWNLQLSILVNLIRTTTHCIFNCRGHVTLPVLLPSWRSSFLSCLS